MTGYRRKTMQLWHGASSAVEFTVEVDFLGTDQWHVYQTFSVDDGEVLTYPFDDGYQAHWVRITSDTATTATAWFIYDADGAAGNADFDRDGDVDGADMFRWQRGQGSTGQTDNSQGDANGDGKVDSADLSLWKSEIQQAR